MGSEEVVSLLIECAKRVREMRINYVNLKSRFRFA